MEVFGNTFGMPIGISPSAMQKLAHKEGENASAKGLTFWSNFSEIS